MKRVTKNIICFLVVILLIGSICYTIYLAKDNLSNNNNLMMFSDNNQYENMLEVSNSENEQNNLGSDMQTPPEKPDGDDNFIDNSDMQTPPEKPDGSEMENDEYNMPLSIDIFNNDVTLTTPYYVAIILESLLLSFVIIYLIQSKFNKKTIKETYFSSDKILINILSTIILTGVLTFGVSFLANKFVLNSNKNTQNKMLENNSNISYSSNDEITESTSISNKEYISSVADENALSVSGDIDVTVDDITVTKTGDSDGGDNTSFYGTNSAIIAKDGAVLTIKNSNITTDATGANGVFSYGGSATTNNSSSDGTIINISDSTITTSKDNSGGIMTTGGGVTNATNLTINTSGISSAAIRSDRGGGEVNVDGGTYKTTGQGSPSIYSTANISVKNASLIATASEGIVIEGKNSVTIENVDLIDTNSNLNGQSTTYKNIFLYQSMSGDADDGISEFTAKDSTITTNKGDSFYITNTSSKITLSNNTIVNNDATGNFLRAKEDSWGNSGSNGGNVTLVMKNQKVTGNIVIDSISTLDMTMKSSSTYTGVINGDNSAKSIKIILDKSSKIKLMGDSYITSIDNADSTNSNIDFNGYKLYVDGNSLN